MRMRQLTPDIEVSEIGFGNWTVTTGCWGDYSRQEAVALHRAAFDAGVTFFDTASVYHDGYGEEVLAEALGEVREQIVIGTKFGYDLDVDLGSRGQQERPHRTDVASVAGALDDSLRRLGTDVIDVWQLHNPRMAHLVDDELFAFLQQVKEEGKVRATAIALGPRIGWRDEGLHAMHTRDVDVVHMIHNMLEQDPGRDLVAAARETDTGLIVRVPHSSGLLEGHLHADTVFPANDHRRHRPRSWLLEGVQKVERLRFLERSDRTLGQAALRWVLDHDVAATALPNIYDVDQLQEFVGASDAVDLTDEEHRMVAELYADGFGVVPEADQETRLRDVS